MNRVWIGNFDFETTLAGETPSRELLHLAAELTFAFLPVVEPGDALLVPGEFETEFLAPLQRLGLPEPIWIHSPEELSTLTGNWQAIPWGWTEPVRALCRRWKWICDAPVDEVVRRVHSREYTFQWCRRLQVQPPEVHLLHSVEELTKLLGRLRDDTPWVIKSIWGGAGRGQLRRRGNALSPQDRRGIQRLLKRDGLLVWEPWLNRIEEAGLQWTIPCQGPPVFTGLVPLLSDRHGQYIGSLIPPNGVDPAPWEPAIEIGHSLCEDLQREGYFGPLGIDAMRYLDETGTPRLRPVQEINARWTMGRLAMAWRRYLPAASTACWLLQTGAPCSSTPAHAHWEFTSPFAIGGLPAVCRQRLGWSLSPCNR